MTNSGWPDPTDWARRLHQDLSRRQAIYEQEPDVLLKRKQAGMILARVVHALMELPPFMGNAAHLPLKDLLIFLSDLDRGRDHPWSAPVNFGGTNITTTAQNELKMWVRAANSVLQQNGFKPVEAARHIAMGLTKSGRTGRANREVQWKRVHEWCREDEAQLDREIRETVERWWRDFRASTASVKVVDGSGKPVGEKALAGVFADQIWSLPHLRDRPVSGGSD